MILTVLVRLLESAVSVAGWSGLAFLQDRSTIWHIRPPEVPILGSGVALGAFSFFFFLVARPLMSCFAADALVWSTEMVVALMSRPLRDISLQKNLSPPSQGKRATPVSSFSSQTLSLSAILHNSSVCASTNTSVSGLPFNGSFKWMEAKSRKLCCREMHEGR